MNLLYKFNIKKFIKRLLLLLLLILPTTIFIVTAVKHSDFKTCANTSFCRRNRAYGDKISANQSLSPYVVLKETLRINDNGILSGDLFNHDNKKYFVFELHFLLNNVARLRIDEKSQLKSRYDEDKIWALVQQKEPLHLTSEYSLIPSPDDHDHKFTTITYGKKRDHKVVVHHSPFYIQFFLD